MDLRFVPTSKNVELYYNYNPSSLDPEGFNVFISTPEMVFLFGLTTLFLLAGIFATMLAFLVGKYIYKGD